MLGGGGGGWRVFLWAGPLILLRPPPRVSFRIWGYVLPVEHISCVITTWWCHQMETFSALLAICSPHKGQWRRALMFSLIWAWINGWESNPEAGDLRGYRTHYDVIVMELWPTSVGHPFSCLNISWGLTGGKHYHKIIIPIFRLVLQNFAIPGYFPYILLYCYLFSLLSSGWFVIAVCGSISVRELVKYLESL